MGTRSHHQSKSAPEPTTAAPQNTLQPRPFAPQAESVPTLEDVQSQLEHTQRFGHHLSNFAASQPEPPPPGIQPKLTIGAPGDKYEQEADRVAQQVVQQIQMPKPSAPPLDSTQPTSAVQRESMPMQHDLQLKPLLQREEVTEEDELQMKPILQRKTEAGSVDASTDLENSIQQSRGSGQPLADSIRQPMEHAFGNVDFSGVKVHTNAKSDQLNRSIQALAFTTGQDIFFRQGAYQPGSSGGQELLAHELTHVVQQNGSTVHRQHNKIQRHAGHSHEEIRRSFDRTTSLPTTSCQCSGCSTIQRTPQISGQSLTEAIQRQTHHQGCPCCNGGQLKLQRKEDNVAHGSQCPCPLCKGNIQAKLEYSKVVQRHGGHEHDEEHLQAKLLSIVQRQPIASQVSTNTDNVIQRHSSHEHYLLGNTDPDGLASIPLIREAIANYNDSSEKLSPEDYQELKQKRDESRHTMKQHLELLENFRKNANFLEDESNRGGKKTGTLAKKEDGTWDVPYISVPVRKDGTKEPGSDSVVLLYGEVNTLPDFVGNPEALANTEKSAIVSLIQGVRQRVYRNLIVWYNEIALPDDKQEEQWEDKSRTTSKYTRRGGKGDAEEFESAQGERYVNNSLFETKQHETQTMKGRDSSQKSEAFSATLERNACHFAPYSWDAWQKYHEAAIKLATESAEKIQQAAKMRELGADDKSVIAGLEEEARQKSNQAMLQNAFGEHYLQDSFASGHLIDKTFIMQKFVQWLASKGDDLGGAPDAKARWDMTQMVANTRGLKSDPQALDNAMIRDQLNYTESAELIGMKPTGDIIFMMWWRDKAAKDGKMQTVTLPKLVEYIEKSDFPFPVSSEIAQLWLEDLISKDFVEKEEVKNGDSKYTLDKSQINVVSQDTVKMKRNRPYTSEVYKPDFATDKKYGEQNPEYENYLEEQASEFNIQAYNAFLSNTYIQAVTNVFHDKFCLEGLDVVAINGTHIGKVYGDRSMLTAGAQGGVKYAAETSELSRNSLFKTLSGEALTPDEETAQIRSRFPGQVKGGNGLGQDLPLKDWNLKLLIVDNLFDWALTKAAASVGGVAKMTGAKGIYKKSKGGGASEGNAINVKLPAHAKEEGF